MPVEKARMPIGLTKTLPLDFDSITPDGAEVRRLQRTPEYNIVHYRLKPGQILLAFPKLTLEELWHFLSGCGDSGFDRLGEGFTGQAIRHGDPLSATAASDPKRAAASAGQRPAHAHSGHRNGNLGQSGAGGLLIVPGSASP
jgi:hypothetical protein